MELKSNLVRVRPRPGKFEIQNKKTFTSQGRKVPWYHLDWRRAWCRRPLSTL